MKKLFCGKAVGNGLPLFFILPCNNAGLFDVFDREGTGKLNAGSCFFPIYALTFKVYLKAKEMTDIPQTQNPAAFVEIDDIFDVSDTPWENAKGVCLKKVFQGSPAKSVYYERKLNTMKNIHSINFIKHTTLLACSALLAVSLAACSQPAASDAASTAGSASSSATSDTAQIPNPWTGCTTLADAAALTGYDFTVPDSVDGYPDVTIAVLESEQLTEVQYSSGNARLCLRKAPGSDDISGDFNQYAESNAVDVDGRSVTLQGNDGQVQLATWLDGDYTYSIGIYREDGTGLTADEMTGLVKAAK